MGKKRSNLKFIEFYFKDNIQVVLLQIRKDEYVWLMLYLKKKFRNKFISSQIIKYILYKLKGVHHIHWIKSITSISNLSFELEWKIIGNSEIFQNCYSAFTESLNKKYELFELFEEILILRKGKCVSRLKSYRNQNELGWVLDSIRSYYLS